MIEARQNGILDSREANAGDNAWICSFGQQIANNVCMISLGCCYQCSLLNLCHIVDISFESLDEELNHFQVTFVAGFVKRGHFAFVGEGGIDEFGFFLKQKFDICKIVSFNVIVEVLFIVGLCQVTFSCSHIRL